MLNTFTKKHKIMTTKTSKKKKNNEDEIYFTDILLRVISQWNEKKEQKRM